MKPRSNISANELELLYQKLERLLDRVGLETQPGVAAKILALSQNQDAGMSDYADAVRTDWALTGRLLRLANSAFYAQRNPVTTADRALVVLGADRAKAVCLGFYLSRAASAAGARQLAESTWTQSIYRASLAAAIAQDQCPRLAAEAYVVGLMLDCGVPLMTKLMGDCYIDFHNHAGTPQALFEAEFNNLPYTHADVVATLMRKWKIPTVIAKPIIRHHTIPSAKHPTDPVSHLHRIAYYAGSVSLDNETALPRTSPNAPNQQVAQSVLKINPETLTRIIKHTDNEYRATVSIFEDIASTISDLDDLTDHVQLQLASMMDEHLSRAMLVESRGGCQQVVVADHNIEIEPAQNNEVIAFIASQEGERLISCRVDPREETPHSIRNILGLEDASEEELDNLIDVMRSIAA